MAQIPNFIVIYDQGEVVGGFDLETAINAARDLANSGKRVTCIEQGKRVILEGKPLEDKIRAINCPEP